MKKPIFQFEVEFSLERSQWPHESRIVKVTWTGEDLSAEDTYDRAKIELDNHVDIQKGEWRIVETQIRSFNKLPDIKETRFEYHIFAYLMEKSQYDDDLISVERMINDLTKDGWKLFSFQIVLPKDRAEECDVAIVTMKRKVENVTN